MWHRHIVAAATVAAAWLALRMDVARVSRVEEPHVGGDCEHDLVLTSAGVVKDAELSCSQWLAPSRHGLCRAVALLTAQGVPLHWTHQTHRGRPKSPVAVRTSAAIRLNRHAFHQQGAHLYTGIMSEPCFCSEWLVPCLAALGCSHTNIDQSPSMFPDGRLGHRAGAARCDVWHGVRVVCLC